MCIAAVFTLSTLWDFLSSYEKNNPLNTLKEYTGLLEQKKYEEFIYQCGFTFSQMNSKHEYIKYLNNICKDKITAVNILDTDTEKVYMLKSGNADITKLYMMASLNKDKFGLSEWEIYTDDFEKNNAVKLYVPYGMTVKINETDLNDTFLEDREYAISEYTGIGNESLIPKFHIYSADGLLNHPSVTAEYKGKETGFYPFSDNSEYIAFIPVSDNEINEAKQATETAAKMYSEFSTTHIQFTDLMPYLMEGTDFYKRLKTFENEWYKEHTLSYENISVTDIRFYSDIHFSSQISYTYIVDFGNRQMPYDISYKLYFVKINGEWKLASLVS